MIVRIDHLDDGRPAVDEQHAATRGERETGSDHESDPGRLQELGRIVGLQHEETTRSPAECDERVRGVARHRSGLDGQGDTRAGPGEPRDDGVEARIVDGVGIVDREEAPRGA